MDRVSPTKLSSIEHDRARGSRGRVAAFAKNAGSRPRILGEYGYTPGTRKCEGFDGR
jgi:hypothetical protein